MATAVMLPVLLLALFCAPSSSSFDSLRAGSYLSVETRVDVLTSSNGTFSAGLRHIGNNSYCFAIWFNKPSCTATANNCTIGWMANGGQSVNGDQSVNRGSLVLKDADQIPVWETKTVSKFFTMLKLEEGGNLILSNMEDHILWQSYDSPTDTLLPLQPFNENLKLISSRNKFNEIMTT